MYSDGKEVHCEHQPCIEVLPMFWGWVANAKYEGTIKIQEVTYDEWVGTVSGGHLLACSVIQSCATLPAVWCRHRDRTRSAT